MVELYLEDDDNEEEIQIDPKIVAVAERKFRESQKYIDFLFRQLGSATYRFNLYFENELESLAEAIRLAEDVKTQAMIKAAANSKKKKKKQAKVIEFKIHSFKMIHECAVILLEDQKSTEHNELVTFLDHYGKLAGSLLIAKNFLKFLTKSYPDQADELANLQYYYTYWNAFSLRMYDYENLTYPKNLLPESLSDQVVELIKWPLAIRTSLYCGIQFLKTAADLTNVRLLNNNWTEMRKVVMPEEFVCMVNIDENFYKRKARRLSMATKFNTMKMMGLATKTMEPDPEPFGSLPLISADDEKYTAPITFDTILFKFPSEIPENPKKQKGKGKKKKVPTATLR